MLKYMLDTNIVIYVLKHRPAAVREKFNSHAEQLCISTTTLAELYHGAEKSSQVGHNMRQIEDFASRLVVLDYDARAASHYGDIRATLEADGNVIGVNDLHIAGHARSEGLALVTNNEREFSRVEALRVETWVG